MSSKRECCECRENEKTFRNNLHYKCVSKDCENYIKPVVVDNDNKLNNSEYVSFLENVISNLTKEINLLRFENQKKK